MPPSAELTLDKDLVEDVKAHSSGAQIIKSVNVIKKKMGGASMTSVITDKEIKAAKKNLDETKEKYDMLISPEMEALQASFKLFIKGLDKTTEEFHALCNSTLNIKGSAGMNDYPLATEICRSLFMFLTEEDVEQPKGLEILHLHVSALRIVFKQRMKGAGGDLGNQLIQDLHKLHNLNRRA